MKIYSKYKTNGGSVYPIVIGAVTQSLAFGSATNEPTVLGITTEATLAVRKDVSEVGITTRKVRARWVGAPPPGYTQGATLSIVVLTPELFEAIRRRQRGTYGGGVIEVISKKEEQLR